jgi:NADH:ubiquinone oxidoreductase subunit 4 (subunit M)
MRRTAGHRSSLAMLADRIINGVLMAIGVAIFYALWRFDILPLDVIWKIISGEV